MAAFCTHRKPQVFPTCFSSCPRSVYKSSSGWGQLLKPSPGFVGTSKQDPPPLVFHKFSAREALLYWQREWEGKEVVLGRLLPGANPEPRTCVQGVYWRNAPGKPGREWGKAVQKGEGAKLDKLILQRALECKMRLRVHPTARPGSWVFGFLHRSFIR